jgi:hypothetical protein
MEVPAAAFHGQGQPTTGAGASSAGASASAFTSVSAGAFTGVSAGAFTGGSAGAFTVGSADALAGAAARNPPPVAPGRARARLRRSNGIMNIRSGMGQPRGAALDIPGWRVIARAPCPVPWLVSAVRMSPSGNAVLVTFGGEWRQASFLGSLQPSRAYPILRIFALRASSPPPPPPPPPRADATQPTRDQTNSSSLPPFSSSASPAGVKRKRGGLAGRLRSPISPGSTSTSSVASTLRPPISPDNHGSGSHHGGPMPLPFDIVCVKEIRSPIEAVNAATFHPLAGQGALYGTLCGKIVQLRPGRITWTAHDAATKIQSLFKGWALRRARSFADHAAGPRTGW